MLYSNIYYQYTSASKICSRDIQFGGTCRLKTLQLQPFLHLGPMNSSEYDSPRFIAKLSVSSPGLNLPRRFWSALDPLRSRRFTIRSIQSIHATLWSVLLFKFKFKFIQVNSNQI